TDRTRDGGFDIDVNATAVRPRFLNLSATAPRLTFDRGVTLTIHGYALIGRSPTPDPGDPPAQLLPIEDRELSISKTHLAVGIDDRGFWVSDRHSTNGSAVTGPDRERVRCVPGQRYYVLPGSTVHIGDRSFDVVMSDLSVAGPR
ncbi:MAG: FHA domain-containing protein, partial [Mycobacteriales bacterium]